MHDPGPKGMKKGRKGVITHTVQTTQGRWVCISREGQGEERMGTHKEFSLWKELENPIPKLSRPPVAMAHEA